MISYRHADLLNRFKETNSPVVLIGIDEDYIVQVEGHRFNEEGWTIPRVFRNVSTCSYILMDRVDDILRTLYHDHKIPIGDIDREKSDDDLGTPFAVNTLDSNFVMGYLDSLKKTMDAALVKDGIKFESSAIVPSSPAHAVEYRLPSIYKKADILQRFKQRAGWLGLPVRFLESKPSNYVVKSQDERTIFVGPADATNTATFRMSDATLRDGTVTIVPHEDAVNYVGFNVTIPERRYSGRVEEIRNGYIVTAAKKIDIKNWKITIDQRARAINLKL